MSRRHHSETHDGVAYDVLDPPSLAAREGALPRESVELDGELYDVIDPPAHATREDLSPWAAEWLPHATADGEALYRASEWVPVALAGELGGRFTRAGANWRANSLRSLLEVSTGLAVFASAWSLTSRPLWSLALGTASACAAMLVNSSLSLAAAHAARAPWTGGLLRACGFDAEPGCARREQLRSVKTVLFGYVGLDAIAAIVGLMNDEQQAGRVAALVVCTSVALVASAEVLTSWAPSARLAAALEGRWTRIGDNWARRPARSFLEVALWLTAVASAFLYSHSWVWSWEAGTAAAIAVCLAQKPEDDECDEGDEADCCWPGARRNGFGELVTKAAAAATRVSLGGHATDVMEDFSG